MMHKAMTRTAFIVFAAFTLVIGCSDANADETLTYLPADQPCTSTDDETDSPPIPDVQSPPTNQSDRAPEGNTDLDRHLETDPGSPFLHFSDVSPASDPGDRDELLPAADEHTASLEFASADDNGDETEEMVDGADTIDINSAGPGELTELPGIGPALAERIVEYRQQRRFDSPSQLQRIEGIGPATYEELVSKVRVD